VWASVASGVQLILLRTAIFEFIAFLKFRARLVTNLAVEESNLATLYSEFAEEDRQFAELGMSEYAELLKHEN